jgi:hypothetical protein
MVRFKNVNYVHVLALAGCVYVAIRAGWVYAVAYGAVYCAGYMGGRIGRGEHV